MSSTSSRPKLRPETAIEHFDGGVLLLDDGDVHRVDPPGAVVIGLLDGTRTLDEVVAEIANAFDVPLARVQQDVGPFLDRLDRTGLLVGEAPPSRAEPEQPVVPLPEFDKIERLPVGPDLVHESGPWASLGWTFRVRSCDPQLGQYLAEILEPFAGTEDGDHSYDIHRDPSTGGWEIWVDQTLGLQTRKTWLVVAWLLWHITQQAIAVTDTHLLLHAGAAALGGRPIVVCGPMNRGKSTLIGALVARGWTYLTDEAVALHLGDGSLTPYPRPLVVEKASWRLLPELAPEPSWRHRFRRRAWHLNLSDPRRGFPPSRVTSFVLLQERTGDPTRLTPLPAIDAMEQLCRNAWNLRGLGGIAFALLAREVRYAECYSMHVNDLDAADRALRSLVAG